MLDSVVSCSVFFQVEPYHESKAAFVLRSLCVTLLREALVYFQGYTVKPLSTESREVLVTRGEH